MIISNKINKIIFFLVFLLIFSAFASGSNVWLDNSNESIIEKNENLSTAVRGRVESIQNYDWESMEYWNITGSEFIKDNITSIKRSISIQAGGSLVIDNSTIFINSSEKPIFIHIETGGYLSINNSKFTLKNVLSDKGYKFFVKGDMEINNSEIYYLGYLTSICRYETCSGEILEDKYSTGIDIQSNNVWILNSIIQYSMDASIFINNSSPIIKNNLFSNNTKALTIYNTSVRIDSNNFIDNYLVFELESCQISINDCIFDSTFPGSSELGIFGYLSKVNVTNSTFKDIKNFLYTESCEILIENSSIIHCIVGGAYDSRFELNNSIVKGISENLGFMMCSVYLKNNQFSNCISGPEIYSSNEVLIENNSFLDMTFMGLQIVNYDFTSECIIKDNVFDNNINGIYIIGSRGTIEKNRITNSTEGGVVCYLTGVIRNNYISMCSDGLVIIDTIGMNVSVYNNVIFNNQDGLSCLNSDVNIEFNIIANNSHWGINLSNCEPKIKDNIFSNEQFGPNAYGNIVKVSKVEFHIKDSFNNYIGVSKLKIFDEKDLFYFEESVNFKGPYSIDVPVYEITNTNERIDFTEFQVLAIWDRGYGVITSNKSFNIQNTNSVTIDIPLPDLYITEQDIIISDENPKQGDQINILVTIHYNGMVDAENVNIKITANNIKVEEFQISFNGSDKHQSQTKNVTWVVSEYLYHLVSIKVKIQPDSVEYGLPDYENNNSASKLIEIDQGSEIKLEWTDQSGAILCGIMIIVIILIVILILILIIKQGKNETKKDKTNLSKQGTSKVDQKKTIREQLQDEYKTGPRIRM